MRTDFVRGSSEALAPVQIPTEYQPWASRHVARIELRAVIFRIPSEQPLQYPFGTQHEPLLNYRQLAHPTYTYARMNGGERGGTKGQRGSDSPATRARPSWPTHTPPCARLPSLPMAPPSTLTMHTHRSLVRLAYSYTAFCGNRRRERTPPPKLGS